MQPIGIAPPGYRGRIAPSPTGYLHLGHARTFWTAQERALAQKGCLVLRNEDLYPVHCQAHFVTAMIEDLKWLGLAWQEGPDCGGPFGPYAQRQRHALYLAAFETLRAGGWVYPCVCSRQDVRRALRAPHARDDEPIYPGTCRPTAALADGPPQNSRAVTDGFANPRPNKPINWRFKVTPGEIVSFVDAHYGPQQFTGGQDFGNFVVWRYDQWPAYQLAVVVDDALMRITEVVRGADLLLSTARQILLYRALNYPPPQFCHCPLMVDATGQRLAKRHGALSLRTLRAEGLIAEEARARWR